MDQISNGRNVRATCFSAFYQYLKRVVDTIPLNKSITSAVNKSYSGKWAEEMPSPDIIIGRTQDGTALIDSMFENIDLSGLEQVTVCTPFFDIEGDAIKEIFTRAGKPAMRVLVQNKRTNLSCDAVRNLPKEISVLPVEYLHEEGGHYSFLHSKFYAFEKKNIIEIFAGSANCSRAALMSSGSNGNAELLTKITLQKEEYENLFLSELEFINNELELTSKSELDDQQDEEQLKIIAVRQSGSEVRIAYSVPDSYSISACFVNSQKHNFNIIDNANISVKVTFNPHRVHIEATNKELILQSPIFWVDDEIELQISSRDRKLANTIDARIKYGEWNISGWIEIMRLIHSNLDYESSLQNRRLPSSTNGEENGHKKFKYDDIFSDDFNLLATHDHIDVHSEKERLHGFQQMLLSWFGVGWKSDFYDENQENENENNDNGDNTSDDNEDRPEKIKLCTKRHKAFKKEDKQQALRVARRIVKKLISPDFIKSRPASLLGIDLSIIGTLLCSGLCEGWLESDDFYNLSYDIWHTFFFDANVKAGKHGWIEVLHDQSGNRKEYQDSISSIELSSILIMWALAAQRTKDRDGKTLFMLGCITSIARTEWIWNIENLSIILPHLRQNLINIKMINGIDSCDITYLNSELKHLLQRGVACKKLFDYLKNTQMSELRSKIQTDQLSKGEILWQGEKHGLCILNETCNRSSKQSVNVLSLDNPKSPLSFKSDYLLSAKELIEMYVIPTTVLSNKERKIIMYVLEQFLK